MSDVLADLDHLVEVLGFDAAIVNRLLVGRQIDRHGFASLGMKVETIGKIHLGDVLAFDPEEVVRDQRLVCLTKCCREARVRVLDHALDANVLDYVADVEWHLGEFLTELFYARHRSEEGMADFVSDEQVINVLA